MNSFIQTLKTNFVTLLVTTIVAIITVFSDTIVGDIRFSLNKADLRVASYEKFTSSISNFVFNAEIVTEFYDQGWTTASSLKFAVPPYNDAITDLRKNEYVTYGMLNRFWTKDDINRFEDVMETVKKIDFQVHSLNPEAEAVINGTKLKADIKFTEPIADTLKSLNRELETRVKKFLLPLI